MKRKKGFTFQNVMGLIGLIALIIGFVGCTAGLINQNSPTATPTTVQESFGPHGVHPETPTPNPMIYVSDFVCHDQNEATNYSITFVGSPVLKTGCDPMPFAEIANGLHVEFKLMASSDSFLSWTSPHDNGSNRYTCIGDWQPDQLGPSGSSVGHLDHGVMNCKDVGERMTVRAILTSQLECSDASNLSAIPHQVLDHGQAIGDLTFIGGTVYITVRGFNPLPVNATPLTEGQQFGVIVPLPLLSGKMGQMILVGYVCGSNFNYAVETAPDQVFIQ